MGNIGDPISETIPAVGSAGTTYATNLVAFLTEVEARLEAKVPKASLAAGALDMNGDAVQNASYLGLSTQASTPTTPNGSLQRYGGNLYWINTGGAVQITSGTTLNTSLVGGITGDYGGANPAQFRFVDADQEYYAYDDYAGGAWARVWARNFDIAAGATSAIRARLAFGGAGSYTLTLPAALPGSDSVLQVTSAGAMSASNTLANSLTVQDLKLSNSRYKMLSGASFQTTSTAGSTVNSFTGNWVLGNSSSTALWATIPLDIGDLWESITVYVRKQSDATNTITCTAYYTDVTTGTPVSINANSNAANNPGYVEIAQDCTETIADNRVYYIHVIQSDATPSVNDTVLGAKIKYKRV